jgi:hypothetical protein
VNPHEGPAGASDQPTTTPPSTPYRDAEIVASQLGRVPRSPWRVGARCRWGFPTAIVSPSRLSDGTPFPTYAWLTCPWLSQRAAAAESGGGAASWAARAATDAELRRRLTETDSAVRDRRAAESDGIDSCAAVGIAGQRDSAGVKCLHAHIALAVVGISDPVGEALLAQGDPACTDEQCARLTTDAGRSECAAHAKEEL